MLQFSQNHLNQGFNHLQQVVMQLDLAEPFEVVGGLISLVSVSRKKVFGGDFSPKADSVSERQTDRRHTLPVSNGPLHDQLHILT